MHLLLNCWTEHLQVLHVHRSYVLEGTGQYRISSLTVRHSKFKLCRCIGNIVGMVLGNTLCNLDPKVKLKGTKAGICESVPLTATLVFLYYNNYFELHLDFGKKTVLFLSN